MQGDHFCSIPWIFTKMVPPDQFVGGDHFCQNTPIPYPLNLNDSLLNDNIENERDSHVRKIITIKSQNYSLYHVDNLIYRDFDN